MNNSFTISGRVHTWHMGDKRQYLQTVLPYGVARRVLRSESYDHHTGHGEQRAEVPTHVSDLAEAIRDGTFTPTSLAAGLRPAHRVNLSQNGDDVSLEVFLDQPLPLTDGQQRMAALRKLREVAERQRDARMVERIDDLPLPIVIHLTGDTQRDFINLQLGRSVDPALLHSLRIRQGMFVDNDLMKRANDVATLLHTSTDSPFFKQIRFNATSHAPIPVTTLAGRGASDASTSLVGMAKLANFAGIQDAKPLANIIISLYQHIRKLPGLAPLLSVGMPLAPPPEGGRGQATCWVGVSTVCLYWLKANGRTDVTPRMLEKAGESAALTMGVACDMSIQAKRATMREFAKVMLEDVQVEKHGGIPVELLQVIAPSAYGLPSLPKPKRPARRRPKQAKAATVPPAPNLFETPAAETPVGGAA